MDKQNRNETFTNTGLLEEGKLKEVVKKEKRQLEYRNLNFQLQ